MPIRNIRIIIALLIVGLFCAGHVSRYGRTLLFVMDLLGHESLDPLDEQTLFEGAVIGMAIQGDDYTDYISPDRMSEFNEELDGKFAGVGVVIEINPADQRLIVLYPIQKSPAAQAGIQAGDTILRIDGTSTRGLSLEDASELMRGEPGHPVTLSLQRRGRTEPLDVEVIRDVVFRDTIHGCRRLANGTAQYFIDPDQKIAYLWIDSFSERTDFEFRDIMQQLSDDGIRGLIVDMRDNPGGLLKRAVDIGDLFVPSGLGIVSTRLRDGSVTQQYDATDIPKYEIPIAVLIDNQSASAAEILAACLQDHGLAVVIGSRSYGKGTVQELYELQPDLGMLKVTTAGYWRPSGRNIHRHRNHTDDDPWGVLPSPGYEFELDAQQRATLLDSRYRRTLVPFQLTETDGSSPEEISSSDDPDNGQCESVDPEIDPELYSALEYLRETIKLESEN